MSFSSYADLKSQIGTWLARDDLTERIPDFITLAEAGFNRRFRVREMEQRATATTTTAVYYAWPSDFLEIRFIKMDTNPPVVLTYLSPEQIEGMEEVSDQIPRYWSDIQSQLRVAPIPQAGLTMEINYFKKLALATDTNNWLLSKYPDIYLYGSLVQAEPYLMNDARVATWKSLLDAGIDQLDDQDWRVKAGASPRTVRTDYLGA